VHHDQIALQLYTVRDLASRDLSGTLRAVAAAGYGAVELGGLPEAAPGVLARLLDESGLRAIASHEAIETLRDDASAVADRLVELECDRVIVPWIPEEDRQTAADVVRFVASLGGFARRFADRGIRLGYHNHSFEFAPLGGTTVWDILLAELPPEIELELDVFWLAVGGRDPVIEISATAGRVRLLHMKDRAPGPKPVDVPAGDGILPFPEIVVEARAAGVEWYVAEQDQPRDTLNDIARAYRYLESLAI